MKRMNGYRLMIFMLVIMFLVSGLGAVKGTKAAEPGDDEPTPTLTEPVEPTPTEAPTEEPTPEPTAEPTAEPTPVPTEAPTPTPTEEATPTPTEAVEPAPTEEVVPEPTPEPTPTPKKSNQDKRYLDFLMEKDDVEEQTDKAMGKVRAFFNIREEDLERLPRWLRTGYSTFLICGACLIPLCWVFGILLAKSHPENRKWVKRGYFGFCLVIPLVITAVLIGMPCLYVFFASAF